MDTEVHPTPIFLVGPARSGTTHLQHLLSEYVRSGPETFFFTHLFPLFGLITFLPRSIHRFAINRSTRWWSKKTKIGESEANLVVKSLFLKETSLEAALRILFEAKPPEVILEKTPGHGAFVREILALLPGARVLQISRNPYDVAASRSRTGWRGGTVTAALKWRRNLQIPLSDLPICETTYECLVSDPSHEIHRIVTHWGLEKHGSSVGTPYSTEHEPWKLGAERPTHGGSVGTGLIVLPGHARATISCLTEGRGQQFGYESYTQSSIVRTAIKVYAGPKIILSDVSLWIRRRLIARWSSFETRT